jgi:signal-transduction protein with cAMP-binding, CBS, and nucleotidyltransferase domain
MQESKKLDLENEHLIEVLPEDTFDKIDENYDNLDNYILEKIRKKFSNI